jgi:Ca2+-binding EF-hand superfamily protein
MSRFRKMSFRDQPAVLSFGAKRREKAYAEEAAKERQRKFLQERDAKLEAIKETTRKRKEDRNNRLEIETQEEAEDVSISRSLKDMFILKQPTVAYNAKWSNKDSKRWKRGAEQDIVNTMKMFANASAEEKRAIILENERERAAQKEEEEEEKEAAEEKAAFPLMGNRVDDDIKRSNDKMMTLSAMASSAPNGADSSGGEGEGSATAPKRSRRRQSISFGKVYEALHMFSSNGNHNLTSLIPGEKVVLLKQGHRGWWLIGKLVSPSDQGYVPSSYLESCQAAEYMLEYFDMAIYGVKTIEEKNAEAKAEEEAKAKAKAEEEAKAKARAMEEEKARAAEEVEREKARRAAEEEEREKVKIAAEAKARARAQEEAAKAKAKEEAAIAKAKEEAAIAKAKEEEAKAAMVRSRRLSPMYNEVMLYQHVDGDQNDGRLSAASPEDDDAMKEKKIRDAMNTPAVLREYSEAFFDMVDQDGDGTISMLEFVKIVNTKRKQFLAHHSDNVLDYFRKIDVDKSGEIDSEELIEHLQKTEDYDMFRIIVELVNSKNQKRSSFAHLEWMDKAKRKLSAAAVANGVQQQPPPPPPMAPRNTSKKAQPPPPPPPPPVEDNVNSTNADDYPLPPPRVRKFTEDGIERPIPKSPPPKRATPPPLPPAATEAVAAPAPPKDPPPPVQDPASPTAPPPPPSVPPPSDPRIALANRLKKMAESPLGARLGHETRETLELHARQQLWREELSRTLGGVPEMQVVVSPLARVAVGRREGGRAGKSGPLRWRGAKIPPYDPTVQSGSSLPLPKPKPRRARSRSPPRRRFIFQETSPKSILVGEGGPSAQEGIAEADNSDTEDDVADDVTVKARAPSPRITGTLYGPGTGDMGRYKWKERTTHAVLNYVNPKSAKPAPPPPSKESGKTVDPADKVMRTLGGRTIRPKRRRKQKKKKMTEKERLRLEWEQNRPKSSLELYRRVYGNKAGVTVHKGVGVQPAPVRAAASKKAAEKNKGERGKFYVPPYATDYELLFRSLNQAVRYGEMSLSDSLSTTKLLMAKDETTLGALGLGLTPKDCEFSEDLAAAKDGGNDLWSNIEDEKIAKVRQKHRRQTALESNERRMSMFISENRDVVNDLMSKTIVE